MMVFTFRVYKKIIPSIPCVESTVRGYLIDKKDKVHGYGRVQVYFFLDFTLMFLCSENFQ